MPLASTRAFAARTYAFVEKFAPVGGVLTIVALAGGLLEQVWPFDLLTHFRVQYAGLLAVFAVALALVRRYLLAVVCVLLSTITFWSVVRYVGLPASTPPTPAEFRLMSYNVWFRTRGEQRVADYLEGSGADVVVLQELRLARARQLSALLPSYPYAYFEAAEPHGVAIFSRWPVQSAAPIELGPGGSRATRIMIRWHDRDVTVVGVHLHWPLTPGTLSLRNGELAALAALARAHDGPLLVTGDFNTTPWSHHYRDAVAASGLSDCARGRGLLATWPSQFPPLAVRIDQCLVSAHWRTLAVRTGPRLGSDHVAAIVDLALRSARESE